jgi:toxin-antitoxin system PIN domain toxin
MILPDVNVLLYAFRSDSPEHSRYRKWMEQVIAGPAAYGMAPQVLSGLVRVATHRRIFARPSRLRDALAFAAAVLSAPNCQIVQPGARHWGIFMDLCRRAGAAGNLVQDAWLAALAIETGCEWITTDRDFARFPGLRWRTPF